MTDNTKEDTKHDESNNDRYRCSNCKGVWKMNGHPVSCPHCNGNVVADYEEIVYREVEVKQKGDDYDNLPEFEELVNDGDDKPTCYECGYKLGEKWLHRNIQAKERNKHPADCTHCGKNPLPPVGRK